jgi:hypothetical protein
MLPVLGAIAASAVAAYLLTRKTMGTIRHLSVAHANNVEGLTGSETPEAFAELLGPGVSPQTLGLAYGKGGYSTCGMVALGIWRRVGVDDIVLHQNYVNGTAVSHPVSFAKHAGAWVRSTTELPRPGDLVVIGMGGSDERYGGMEHVLTVTGRNGTAIESIDGGQTDDAGLQAIKRRLRTFAVRNGEPWLVDTDGSGRRILGWADLEKLPIRAEWQELIDGWESTEFVDQ